MPSINCIVGFICIQTLVVHVHGSKVQKKKCEEVLL